MTEPRTISVYCAAESHAPDRPVVGKLVSSGRAPDGGEHWFVANGPWAQRLTLGSLDAGYNPDLPTPGPVVFRGKFICPACGYDVTIGDRLSAGYTTMRQREAAFETLKDPEAPPAERAGAAAAALDAIAPVRARVRDLETRLTQLADAGQSCISASFLAYMLKR